MTHHLTGAHTPARRGIAGALAGITAFSALAYPALVTAQTRMQPFELAALPGSPATGPRTPEVLSPQVDGTLPVAPSTRPVLVWKDVPAGIGQATFSITSLAAKSPQIIWQSTVAVGSDRVARARVPAGRLEQGTTYGWGAVATSDATKKTGPFQLTIDQQRDGVQPGWSFGGVQVAEATGELVYQWQGPAVPALSGPVSWSLEHRPTNTAQAGLPQGWNLSVAGSTPWTSLVANPDGSVTLQNTGGASVTYTQAGNDQWRPAIGRYHSAGTATLLSQNDNGTFSATDGNRTVTVFSRPTSGAPAHPTKVWTLGAPTVQQQWKDGVLTALTDPVTGNGVGFYYGGQAPCASKADPGFITAPDGQLCGVIDWSGNAVMLEYVQTPTGVQIGRIARATSGNAAVEDLAWDAAGRIAAVRQPLAAAAIGSGVVAGLGEADPRATTQVRYDAQGRVAGITAPAGLIAGATQTSERTGRPAEQFTYAPFTVKATGVSAPVGNLAQAWTDVETLHLEKQRDESGNVQTYAYNAQGSATRTTDVTSGTVTETRYDGQGRPVEQLGPTKGPLGGANAPKTTTKYDQDEHGKAWTGLATRYWGNAGFDGAPGGGTTGPIPPGGTSMPRTLSLNWASSPVGEGPWSARLTGEYVAPEEGDYVFANTTSAQMWVNGSLCQPECKLPLKKDGVVSLQLDVTSPDGGAAGINAVVTPPKGARQGIPTSATRPNYDLATSTTTREAAQGGGNETLTTKAVYNEVTTQLTATVAPSGARTTRTYEPYDPANGQWGRSTGVTDASGRTTTPEYYAQGAVAKDCQGNTIVQQGGLASTNLPGGSSISQVTVPGGGAIKATSPGTTVCGGPAADGNGTTSTTSGTGPDVAVTDVASVDDNPLVQKSSTTSRGVTTSEVTEYDITGQAWASTDAEGTRVVMHMNPYTQKVERIVQTTAKGQVRNVAYTYAPGGDVATITVNGHLLLTNEYAPDGTLLRANLGNGATQVFELDSNNSGRKATTTFPDGTVLAESATHSPTGRMLSRTISGPTGTSTYDYTYNVDGRLVRTSLSGSIPARQTGWTSAYTGKEGAGGNRSSLTTTMADGSTQVKHYTYGADDRVQTVSTGRAQGALEYDAAGRVTKLGKTSLTYDAAGHVLSATDGTHTYAFSNNGDTTTYTDTTGGTTRTVSATASGQGLVLGTDGLIDGQMVRLDRGVSVLMGADGAPVRWVYDDMLGNATWTSQDGAVPTQTQLYAPDGQAISVQRTIDPRTPTDLLLASMGWMNGQGASALRLDTPVTVMGSRTYSTTLGRFMQPDPQVGGTLNAYEYAVGDPINMADPSGNFPWGWIAGAITAAVVGIALGALTFGIGVGATAAYGAGAFFAQVAVGAVIGAASGMAGEMVTQAINNPGAPFDWASIGIAAGIGAASGAFFTGGSAYLFKVQLPGRALRVAMASTPEEAQTISSFTAARRAYQQMRATNVANGKPAWTKSDILTTRSWKSAARQRMAAAESKAAATFDDLMKSELSVLEGGSKSFKSVSVVSKKVPGEGMGLLAKQPSVGSLGGGEIDSISLGHLSVGSGQNQARNAFANQGLLLKAARNSGSSSSSNLSVLEATNQARNQQFQDFLLLQILGMK